MKKHRPDTEGGFRYAPQTDSTASNLYVKSFTISYPVPCDCLRCKVRRVVRRLGA